MATTTTTTITATAMATNRKKLMKANWMWIEDSLCACVCSWANASLKSTKTSKYLSLFGSQRYFHEQIHSVSIYMNGIGDINRN